MDYQSTTDQEKSMVERSTDFIRQIVEIDLANDKHQGRVHTRFPPEPNGYLHIGHAKAITISFGIANDYGGLYNLRFDDTDPVGESNEYVEAIKKDIRWLGFDWQDREFYASDYFEQLYQYAIQLVQNGEAYVCDLSPVETSQYRGVWTKPGRESPYKNRSVEENLDLFGRMRAGEFDDGSRTLRAKIDMSSPNMNLRDPVMYRILRAHHYRLGDAWCIYPTYDFTHGQSDSIEKITHSLCSLEFENHRPLYEWYLEKLDIYRPQQIEFARLNLSYTVMSKRKLSQLVEEEWVAGWDDPRLPTLSGLRRRGYTPESIRDFCSRTGIAKSDNLVDISLLEHCLRQDLNKKANRVMAVLKPLKLVIENYPDDQNEELEAVNNQEDDNKGKRKIPFSKQLYIERDDFMENPPRKFFRLSPGQEVRLMHAYYVTCKDVVKDQETGEIVEIICTYDPDTKGGWSKDGRKVKGTLHWVSAKHAIPAEIRLYDRLFSKENPNRVDVDQDYKDYLNPNSVELLTDCLVEPSLAGGQPGDSYQFLRRGYFCIDQDSNDQQLVFNRSVSLRDTWAKVQKKTK
ncbi:glutamine--tRNA ligase/YqeY domain fusion protein [Candidatus Poribacteria bacterium]|nr:glutamine--tRNA ligase/YqeY domain fusion protein [Candidatus Poribacteria bacterium]